MMIIRTVGAICILVVCGGFGFSLAAGQLKEARMLKQLVTILDNIENELQYRMLPLPTLCRRAMREEDGVLGKIFYSLARELENQISPNVEKCMHVTLSRFRDLPKFVRTALIQLGKQLGRFDLQGQLRSLGSVRNACIRKLKELEHEKESRMRGYKTLGLCAGAALVILFI